MNNNSAIKKGTLAAGFSVASVWFGTHVGAGFATGNQVIQYYVQYGWTAILYPLLSMGILAVVMYVIMKFATMRGLDNYSDTFKELWQPYPKMAITFEIFYLIIILAAVAAAIAGAADLVNKFLHIGMFMSTVLVTVILILLCMFGVKLIIAASTFLSAAILVVAGTMIVVGIAKHVPQIGEGIAAGLTEGKTFEAAWRGILVYAGFQCVSVPPMIAAATTLNHKGVKKAAVLGGIMNGGMLALSGLMLIGWYSEIMAADAMALPNLFVCESIGWDVLIALYSILLFCAFISTCVTLIYTMIVRFEGKFFPKQIKSDKIRMFAVGVIVIGICMALSSLGLSGIIKYAYGYDGYLAILVVVIPVLTIGVKKNKQYAAEHPEVLEAR